MPNIDHYHGVVMKWGTCCFCKVPPFDVLHHNCEKGSLILKHAMIIIYLWSVYVSGLSKHTWRVLSAGYHQSPGTGATYDDSTQASSDEEPPRHTQRRQGRIGRQKQFRRGSDSVASSERSIDSEWVKERLNGRAKRRDDDIDNDFGSSSERRVPRIDQGWFKGKTFEKTHRKDLSQELHGTKDGGGLAREHGKQSEGQLGTAGNETGPPNVFKPIQRDSGKYNSLYR